MATLGALEILVSVKDDNVESQLKKTEQSTKRWGNKLSAWTIAKGKIIGDFATKAISTVGSVAKNTVKAAFDNFADYQQLVGGIDTLFKISSRTVQNNASKAFMTAGISANEYMETVTSFSASLIQSLGGDLIQSLGGDTSRAAEVADMAIIDMADNVNKMGSSMESVQNAYRGFAKQNYTMLDNLKLGYGGTRKEMERLLKDASAWQRTQGKNVKYNINSLADVYEAINAIQQKLEITGTTKDEAMKTVSGSMNAAKAAWQDVLTSIGSGKNIKKSIKNFASTAKIALKNAAPVVRNAVEGLFSAAKDLAPEVLNILNEVGRGIFGKDWDITINWIQNAWNDVKTAFNTAVEWVGNAYNVTVEWIQNAWNTVSGAFNDAKEWVNNAYNVTVEWVNNAWNTVSDAFTSAGEWVNKTFDATINWVQTAWEDVSSAIAEVGKGVWDNTVNFTLGIVQGVNEFIAKISKPITVAVNFLKGNGTVTDSKGGTAYDPGTSDMSLSEWYLKNHHAKGAWTIPQDNYPAVLHRGEMVLNQSQARRYRDGESESVNIPAVIAQSVNESMKRVNFLLNGDKVADLTTKRTKRNINAQTYSRQRAYGGA